ncbi:MAG: isocitrate/isopropylmalate dehydrogenase family protein, partial [Chloroflexi bacterium]|nr:isocitrate/isopropylmalate dehydrogenase family protein [Chloroflexota bacterium]
MSVEAIERAKEHFGSILEEQLARIERIKKVPEPIDYTKVKPVVVGMLGGDGIGPSIAASAQKVLETLLADEIASGKVRFRVIEGLTIENRAAQMKAIPDDVLAEIKECHVTLKGPTPT